MQKKTSGGTTVPLKSKICIAKECWRIGQPQPIRNFYLRSTASDGRTSDCKRCRKIRSSKWKRNPKGKSLTRNNNLMRSFGKDFNEKIFLKMLELQNYVCAICSLHYSNFKKSLAVDHDHHTGKIRGLLCSKCNTGIGNLKDDPKLLKKALEYLLKYG